LPTVKLNTLLTYCFSTLDGELWAKCKQYHPTATNLRVQSRNK